MKAENKRLHDIIDDNITALFNAVNAVSKQANETDVRVDAVEMDLEDMGDKGSQKLKLKLTIAINTDYHSSVFI